MNDCTCLECSETFIDAEFVRRHLRVHGITYQQYVLKWVYDNIVPKCKCGCGRETSWNVALKGYAEFVRGHHAFGRKKSEDEKRRIGEKNSVNMKHYLKDNPDIAKRKVEQLNNGHTPETESKRIEATRRAYASMTQEDKQQFKDRAIKRWENGELRIARVKAAKTWKERYDLGEYDFTERNEKISETITQKYIDGGFEWSRGSYTSTKTGEIHHYRSSWELAYMQKLDSDPDVKRWEYEFTSIPYQLDSVNRHYVPDFHVVSVSDEHKLVEVKPESLKETVMNAAKRHAAQSYCDSRGWSYEEWQQS